MMIQIIQNFHLIRKEFLIKICHKIMQVLLLISQMKIHRILKGKVLQEISLVKIEILNSFLKMIVKILWLQIK